MKIEIIDINEEIVKNIISFFYNYTGRSLSIDRIKKSIEKYPSCIAYKDNNIIGFAYTNRFAPDILELYNIFIHPEYRDKGIGGMILDKIEKNTKKRYSAIILVNSILYNNSKNKKNAINFYINNGYSMIGETKSTKIYFKNLL